ncbi:hypothetical protein MUP01_04920 [Candidatus Bathyarchaeota archaeon]|nr:hypothetical protein [Candidatus Bathyarchaeota archaeon]
MLDNAFSAPMTLAFSNPVLAAQIFMISASLTGLGFFVFVPSFFYYLWKGRIVQHERPPLS